MSMLLKSGDKFYEIRSESLAGCTISSEDFEARKSCSRVAEQKLVWDEYADSVEIGCGCCMSKKSLNASC